MQALTCALLLVLASLAAGCAGSGAAGSPSSPPPPTDTPPAARPLSRSDPGSVSAWAVIRSVGQRGLPVPHPLDVTDQVCQARPCLQSIITDTVQVTSFRTADAAETYARQHDSRAVDTIVVTFSPVLEPAEREALWSAVSAAVPAPPHGAPR
jgi:hypothetical protein